MKDQELLESIVRELSIDATDMQNEINKVVDINQFSKVVEKRVMAALKVNVAGGPMYEQAIRIGAAYYEAFMVGYKYAVEQGVTV
jgi:hypothetical protein